MNYPTPKQKPHSFLLHDDHRTDNYFWMHDPKDPNVI